MNAAARKIFKEVPLLTGAQYTSVRFRYHDERKVKNGPIVKNYGYEDKFFSKGTLPRLKDADKLPMPDYRPSNRWTEKNAMFGQNDYMDLLGGDRIHPKETLYDVPEWLRGQRGSEMALLCLKRDKFLNTSFPLKRPMEWMRILKRIDFLYRVLNTKTKTGFIKKQ